MKKLPLFTAAALAVSTSAVFGAATVDDVTDGSPYYYQAVPGTPVSPGVGGDQGDTDSGINHLPVYHGNFQTNNTYRFVNVAEQVVTIIGDGKHGLWRYQDNGTVRLYIIPGEAGIPVPAGFDLTNPTEAQEWAMTLDPADIAGSYSHFIDTSPVGDPDFAGYKNNANIGVPGTPAPFLDVPIHHPFFGGVYEDHVPIDLAGYYCTMSAADFNTARAAMEFAFDQPGANVVGPLGKRAGLDIKENYPDVLRLESFPDARLWANTKDRDEAKWQQINTDRTHAEIYMVQRPFFNEEYLFIIAVFDNVKARYSQHSYIRPEGPYYDHLVDRGLKRKFRTRLKERPRFNVLQERSNGRLKKALRHVDGFRLYGVHHPGDLSIANGACPGLGGDFGESYYGAAWPTNYQEVTPLCDGILVDIKLYANLDGVDWDNERKNQVNNIGSRNGDLTYVKAGEDEKNYTNFTTAPAANPGTYGVFQDPYLIENGFVNHEQFTATGTDELEFQFDAQEQVECNGDSCDNPPSENRIDGSL